MGEWPGANRRVIAVPAMENNATRKAALRAALASSAVGLEGKFLRNLAYGFVSKIRKKKKVLTNYS